MPEPEPAIPIIDTHIHLFDPSRPEGVPWPPADDTVRHKTALPPRYRQLTEQLGVVGAIEVECSPWLEDNQWVLDVAEGDTIVVGTVGNLEPANPEFQAQLENLSNNALFRGIRYGNLWGNNIRTQLDKPEFVEGLRALSAKGLSLDTANPTVELLHDMVRVTDLVPDLRVIIDHLPKIVVSAEQQAPYESALQELGARPRVFVKVSAVLLENNGTVAYELEPYRNTLDRIWDTFGEDRLLYGSDWPNSDGWGSYEQVLAVAREYFSEKSREAQEKYFWRNSVRAYGWVKRAANQPG
jgi:predicted TIM-barrel fold metal-dependent hydrolase